MTEPLSDATNPAESRSSVWRWWNSLDEDRGGRAELRRCATAAEAAFTPAYHRLLRRLGSRLGEQDAKRVAVVAAVLAHVEREPAGETSVPRMMGTPRGDGQGARIADSRFRQLLRTEDPDELLRELVRLVRQMDRTAPVDALSRDLMRWDERTRMRWARDFYEAAPESKAR